MKAPLIIAALGSVLLSAQAMAATYGAGCPSCSGTPSGTGWRQAAADVSYAYSASISDTIVLCKDNGSGTAVVANYSVVYAPPHPGTTSPSDVSWNSSQGNGGVTCADLGF
ncbi:hypothetical protein ACFJIW_02650 [Tahibacter sp. UC22_41]|uniref:hypothetical protein n=1 Tax=Tahibacter sp. UC22_41 TaxID=3350178 RepID=UPI0036D95360